jgi:hypothetical protein
MLSWHLMWECMPLGAVRAEEHSALVGCRGPQELLIGMCVLGSTTLAGCRGLQGLLIGTCMPGSMSKSRGSRVYFALVERRPFLEPCMCQGAII